MFIFLSMIYKLFKCKFASSLLMFSAYNGDADNNNALFGKQMIYFNIYITGSYFHVLFLYPIAI